MALKILMVAQKNPIPNPTQPVLNFKPCTGITMSTVVEFQALYRSAVSINEGELLLE